MKKLKKYTSLPLFYMKDDHLCQVMYCASANVFPLQRGEKAFLGNQFPDSKSIRLIRVIAVAQLQETIEQTFIITLTNKKTGSFFTTNNIKCLASSSQKKLAQKHRLFSLTNTTTQDTFLWY